MNSLREIEQEIQDLVDGHLSEDRQREVVARISKDPELVALLVSYTGLDIAIDKALRFSPTNIDEVRQAVLKAKPKPRQMIRVLAVAAAVMAGSLFLLWTVILTEKPPRVVVIGAPGTNYELLRAAERSGGAESSDLFAGDGVLVRQGVVELEFASGVHAILDGPAELRFEEKDRVRLVRGSARFRVPSDMSGFQVVTDDAVAIDLGTEFAVAVFEDAPDEIHVIDGRVSVAPNGNPERAEIVVAGQARSVVHKGIPSAIPYRGTSFLSKLPAGLPYLHLPMEMNADGSLVVEGDINGKAGVEARFVPGGAGSGSLGPVEGRFGGALGFNGKGDHIITDWMGIGGDDPRTVAFWAKITPGDAGYDLGCVAWGYRPPTKETSNRKWNVQLARARGTGSRCILNTTFGGLWMEGGTALDDGKWHHVAAVYAGRNLPDGMPDLRLYVDGNPELGNWKWNDPIDRSDGAVRVRTDRRKEIGAHPLTVARSIRRSGSQTYFKGKIDEIYVIAGALRPVDIRNLWQNNRFDPGPATLTAPRQAGL